MSISILHLYNYVRFYSIKEEFWSGIAVFLNTLSGIYELEKEAPIIPGSPAS